MSNIERCEACGQPLDAEREQDERARINARWAGVKSGQLAVADEQLRGAVSALRAIASPSGKSAEQAERIAREALAAMGVEPSTTQGGQSE